MIRIENICFGCAKDLEPLTEIETTHIGLCDVCNEEDKQVAPARLYGYTGLCEQHGLVVPIHKGVGGNKICPICRLVLTGWLITK